jgi:hypothetical protein
MRAGLAFVVGWACLACSPPPAEPTAGSESHFLTSCTDSCGSGLSCLCGTCTTSCGAASECVGLNPAATCVAPPDADAGPSCAQAQTTSHCDVPCSSTEECASFGSSFFCSRGYCRPDPLSRPGEPFAGYGVLCAQKNVTCATAETPAQLTGSYTGQAVVVLSSNALWAVDDANAFTAAITSQSGLKLWGTVSIPSFLIDVSSAEIRGQAPGFTLYAPAVVDLSGCSLEIRSVFSGTLDVSVSPASITGALALRFTGNYSGAACTTDQIENYPATGANFTVAATGQ